MSPAYGKAIIVASSIAMVIIRAPLPVRSPDDDQHDAAREDDRLGEPGVHGREGRYAGRNGIPSVPAMYPVKRSPSQPPNQ